MLNKIQARERFATILSRWYYDHVPAYHTLCDKVLHIAPEAMPVDHFAIRFVDRGAQAEMAFLGAALGMEDHGLDYNFPDKKLVARSYGVPGDKAGESLKYFVSILDHDSFAPETQHMLAEDEAESPHRISGDSRALLSRLKNGESVSESDFDAMCQDLLTDFFDRQNPIKEALYLAIKNESPVAAVGALFAGKLNHVTPFVNHLAEPYNDIEQLDAAMKAAQIEMAGPPIQGAPGSELRQVGTQAQEREVKVRSADGEKRIHAANEYVELAQRGKSPDTGQLYPHFKVEQATNIYLSNVEKSQYS